MNLPGFVGTDVPESVDFETYVAGESLGFVLKTIENSMETARMRVVCGVWHIIVVSCDGSELEATGPSLVQASQNAVRALSTYYGLTT
jgi:hypothetical protein